MLKASVARHAFRDMKSKIYSVAAPIWFADVAT
jgi:hypothetical protein